MARATVKTSAARETPSDHLVKAALSEVVVTDARGRKLALKKPPLLSQYRLVEVMGERAQNEVLRQMIAPLICIASIDGDPVAFPTSYREIEALIQRLDEDGMQAVMEGMAEHFGGADPEKDRERLKN